MVQKKCNCCGVIYEAVDIKGLEQFFYVKDKRRGGWMRNVCKKCECLQHSQKYKDGTYNYSKESSKEDEKIYTLGYF